jgi:hypothetical protein
MSAFNYREFFELRDSFSTQALRLERRDDSKWLDMETAIKLANGELKETQEVLRLQPFSGSRPMPFLWSGFTPLCCISKRVVSLLQDNQITGWSTYPVEVFDRDGDLLPDYVGFAVTGRAGDFQRDLSPIITVTHPWGSSVKMYKGLYFNPLEWDGTDIFLVGGSTIITRKVQKLFKKEKVSNIRLTPIMEVELPVLVFEISRRE